MPLYPCVAALMGLVVERCCKSLAARLVDTGLEAVLAGTAGHVAAELGAGGVALVGGLARRATSWLCPRVPIRGPWTCALRPFGHEADVSPSVVLSALSVAAFLGLTYMGVVLNATVDSSHPIEIQVAELKDRLPQHARGQHRDGRRPFRLLLWHADRADSRAGHSSPRPMATGLTSAQAKGPACPRSIFLMTDRGDSPSAQSRRGPGGSGARRPASDGGPGQKSQYRSTFRSSPAPQYKQQVAGPHGIGGMLALCLPVDPVGQQRIIDHQDRQEAEEEAGEEVAVPQADGHRGPDPGEAQATEPGRPAAVRLGQQPVELRRAAVGTVRGVAFPLRAAKVVEVAAEHLVGGLAASSCSNRSMAAAARRSCCGIRQQGQPGGESCRSLRARLASLKRDLLLVARRGTGT